MGTNQLERHTSCRRESCARRSVQNSPISPTSCLVTFQDVLRKGLQNPRRRQSSWTPTAPKKTLERQRRAHPCNYSQTQLICYRRLGAVDRRSQRSPQRCYQLGHEPAHDFTSVLSHRSLLQTRVNKNTNHKTNEIDRGFSEGGSARDTRPLLRSRRRASSRRNANLHDLQG